MVNWSQSGVLYLIFTTTATATRIDSILTDSIGTHAFRFLEFPCKCEFVGKSKASRVYLILKNEQVIYSQSVFSVVNCKCGGTHFAPAVRILKNRVGDKQLKQSLYNSYG